MPDENRISLDVALKPNDVYHPFLWSWQNLWRWVVAMVLCRVVYDVFFSSSADLDTYPDARSLKLLILLVTALVVLGLILFPYLRILALFRKSPAMRKTRRFTFSPEGVLWDSEDARVECKWSLFARILETNHTFMFFQAPHLATHVPKRCFANHEQIVAVRQIIKTNFRGKWRLKQT
jgi:hypothetical protein